MGLCEAGQPIRVLLADDSRSLTSAWKRLLHRTPGIAFAAAVHDADELEQVLPVAKPNVVVMDLGLGGTSHVTDMKRIVETCRSTSVLVYSGRVEDEVVSQVRAAGARGFVGKHEEPQRLIAAIRRVAQGEVDFPGE